jgi:hypothetical protein
MIGKRLRVLFIMVLSVLAASTISCERATPADLVLLNGKIITVDQHFSIQQAAAVAGDRIVFVGSNKETKTFIGPKTKVIQLEGKENGGQVFYANNISERGIKNSTLCSSPKAFKICPQDTPLFGIWDMEFPGQAGFLLGFGSF